MGKRGNGEGSIYYSEKLKRWVGQYTYNGKRKSIYGKTRLEVKDKINKALVDIKENTYVNKSDVTLIEIIDKYIKEDYDAKLIKEVSYLRRMETANIIRKMDIAYMKIQKITADDINEALLDINNYANSVISKVYDMLKFAYNKAVILKLLYNNIFLTKGLIIKPKSSKETKKVDALTMEEQQLFIDELKKNYDIYTDIFYIATYTGMRIGEILALKGSDIYNNTIHIQRTLTKDSNGKIIVGSSTKTYAGTREIPITHYIKDIFNKKSSNDYLFLLDNGTFINPTTINMHFKKICKNAGIREKIIEKKKYKDDEKIINLKTSQVNTHMLRHTYATRCIESGMNATVLSKLLGHKDIQVTLNTYTSVFNKFKEDEIQKYLDYMSQLH